jgi:hypothetical protein
MERTSCSWEVLWVAPSSRPSLAYGKRRGDWGMSIIDMW